MTSIQDSSPTEVIDVLQSLERVEIKNDSQRRRALFATRALLEKLESPYEKIINGWSKFCTDSAIKVALDVDLFEKWITADEQMTADDLADLTGVDRKLMGKQLSVGHVLRFAGHDKFCQTPFSKALVTPEVAAGLQFEFQAVLPIVSKLPDFLARTAYTKPADNGNTALIEAFNWHSTWFDYLQENLQCATNLEMWKKGYNANKPSWLEFYPSNRIFEGAKQEGPLLVDVGGGRGQDIELFRKKFPDLTIHRLVLEDQPSIIQAAHVGPGIQVVGLNMFEEQPVKGARIYFLHDVIHKWPDAEAREILRNVKLAMTPGYSRIILSETFANAGRGDPEVTCFSILMMAALASGERTVEETDSLVRSVGLKIVNTFANEVTAETVLELDLQDGG